MKIKTALYGSNGHQIHRLLAGHDKAELVAVCAFNRENLPGILRENQNIKYYADLDAMLENPEVELVSLCSPVRAGQAADAIKCLRSGRHVYAEKPCALSERDLDKIIKTAEDKKDKGENDGKEGETYKPERR